MYPKKVLFIGNNQAVLNELRQALHEKGIGCEILDPQNFDPFQHPILVHDCGITVAPCNILSGVISIYDYNLGSERNGLNMLKLIRDSECQKSQTMPLVLYAEGIGEDMDMIEFDEDLKNYSIEYHAEPFAIKHLLTALEIPL